MDWPEIKRGMPRDELIAIHRRIWNYVVKNGEKPYTPYYNDCVGCEVDFLLSEPRNKATCSHCPIKWPGGATCLNHVDRNLYDEWYRTRSTNRARLLAKQIRDIEFKDYIWEKPTIADIWGAIWRKLLRRHLT